MPSYEFRCPQCDKVVEHDEPVDYLSAGFPYEDEDAMHTAAYSNAEWTTLCDGRFRRVWSAPAIGRVDGAGGSPARGSK